MPSLEGGDMLVQAYSRCRKIYRSPGVEPKHKEGHVVFITGQVRQKALVRVQAY